MPLGYEMQHSDPLRMLHMSAKPSPLLDQLRETEVQKLRVWTWWLLSCVHIQAVRLADAAKAAAKAAADSGATKKFGSHMVMMQWLIIETPSHQVHVFKLKLFRTSALSDRRTFILYAQYIFLYHALLNFLHKNDYVYLYVYVFIYFPFILDKCWAPSMVGLVLSQASRLLTCCTKTFRILSGCGLGGRYVVPSCMTGNDAQRQKSNEELQQQLRQQLTLLECLVCRFRWFGFGSLWFCGLIA